MARALTAALVAAALLLGACGDGGAGSAAVRVQVFGDPEELAIYRQVASAYRRETGREVRLLEVGDRKDHLARLVAAAAARRLPDVFLINHRALGAFAARRLLEPPARPGVWERELYPVAVDAFRYDGVLQCVPQNVSSLVVYYNRDLLRQARIPEPAGAWTFRAFLAVARALTRDGRHGVAIDPNTIRMAPFVWSAGGEVFDDPDRPARFTLDTPAARRGLRALTDLRRLGLAPGRRENEALSPEERFVQGDVGMFLSSRRDVPVLRSIKGFTWDVAPFPQIERPASVLHSDGLCVARGSRAAAAGAFVDWALTEGQKLLARGGRTVPSHRRVARSAAFLSATPPRRNQVFLDQIEHMRRLPTTRNFARIEEAADTIVKELYYGGLSLDEALRRLDDETAGKFS